MSKRPPVPPEQRSRKGTGSDPKSAEDEATKQDKNLREQDQQGNIYQNTRNQGYQQDR